MRGLQLKCIVILSINISSANCPRTSPSVYLEMYGTISISDYCGINPLSASNTIVALPPGQLTVNLYLSDILRQILTPHQTVSFPGVSDGMVFDSWMLSSITGPTDDYLHEVSPDNLACPTFGLAHPSIITVETITGTTSNPENGEFTTTSLSISLEYRFG